MTRITTHRSDEDEGSVRLPQARLTRAIIGTFYDVYNELGYGFLESVYRSALQIVLAERNFPLQSEAPLAIHFHGHRIGAYRADLIVDEQVIIEVKAGAVLAAGAKAQLINYLRMSNLTVGLLLYFGPTPEFHRVIASRRESENA